MKRRLHLVHMLLLAIWLLPAMVAGQSLQRDDAGVAANKAVLHADAVVLKSSADSKMEATLHATESAFLLTLTGSGAGTGTVDVNNEAVFLLDNDSTVVVKSIAFQGFESRNFINTYRHEYRVSQEGLEMLSQHDLRRVRKYALTEFKDIFIDGANASNLKTLAASFLQELDKAHLLKPKMKAVAPAFPGGKDVFLTFLNRNFKVQVPLALGQKKEALIQFEVGVDGAVNAIEIKQSAGPQYDTELLRILKRMPRWKPALENGRQVTALVTQPVQFYQQDSKIKVQF